MVKDPDFVPFKIVHPFGLAHHGHTGAKNLLFIFEKRRRILFRKECSVRKTDHVLLRVTTDELLLCRVGQKESALRVLKVDQVGQSYR